MQHPFGPFINHASEILILGSFPSPRSRGEGFYYAHPQNRFWPLLADIFGEAKPTTIEEKKDFLRRHHLALYDALEACDPLTSGDETLQKPVPADIPSLIKGTKVRLIITNGALSAKVLKAHPVDGVAFLALPSTSPRNASFSYGKLRELWSKALK
jgi:TDG/mug DNA glycosylase family protein